MKKIIIFFGGILIAFFIITNCGSNSIVKKEISKERADSNAIIEKENNNIIYAEGNDVNKAWVSKFDSVFILQPNMRHDHRFYGFSKPDIKSERLILFSIFTNDVENNPFGCKFGSYYGTLYQKKFKEIKFAGTIGDFVKFFAIDSLNNKTTIYFEKKWIEIIQQ